MSCSLDRWCLFSDSLRSWENVGVSPSSFAGLWYISSLRMLWYVSRNQRYLYCLCLESRFLLLCWSQSSSFFQTDQLWIRRCDVQQIWNRKVLIQTIYLLSWNGKFIWTWNCICHHQSWKQGIKTSFVWYSFIVKYRFEGLCYINVYRQMQKRPTNWNVLVCLRKDPID